MISDQYDAIIASKADKYSVPFEWIKAIIGAESDFRELDYRYEPKIKEGSYGLMQILASTAKKLGYAGDLGELFNPDLNIDLGAKLLNELRERFGNSFERVYSAYNSGSPDKYLTSSQVKAHVERALTYLALVTGNTSNPPEDGASTTSFPFFLFLIIGGAIFYFSR